MHANDDLKRIKEKKEMVEQLSRAIMAQAETIEAIKRRMRGSGGGGDMKVDGIQTPRREQEGVGDACKVLEGSSLVNFHSISIFNHIPQNQKRRSDGRRMKVRSLESSPKKQTRGQDITSSFDNHDEQAATHRAIHRNQKRSP